MQQNLFYLTLFFVLLSFCHCGKDIDPWQDFAPFATDYNTAQLEVCTNFATTAEAIRAVDYIFEASGLAESISNENALWAHNDSGNPEIIFLIDKNTGALKAAYKIKGITNVDWEDIEVGPGPLEGTSYIYLADIGDNATFLPERCIYRFPEPLFAEAHRGKTIEMLLEVDKIRLVYPGTKQNAETLLLDPTTKDLYIVSKYGVSSKLFVLRYPQLLADPNVLEEVGVFPFREATGGNMSRNGREILIKTYDKILYWNHTDKEPKAIWSILADVPQAAPYNPMELQGEAICITDNGYYTLSEQDADEIPVLYYYKRNE